MSHSEERSDEAACRQAGNLAFPLKIKNEILHFVQWQSHPFGK